MYLYFFDLDDTICNTGEIINKIKKEYNITRTAFKSDQDYDNALWEKLQEYGADKIEPLANSTISLLRQLIVTNPHDVFYITARESTVRTESIDWLKKHGLWLGEEKLIMDTNGIKGKTINEILNNSTREFAFLFDDLIDNHKEASNYKKIISCLPL